MNVIISKLFDIHLRSTPFPNLLLSRQNLRFKQTWYKKVAHAMTVSLTKAAVALAGPLAEKFIRIFSRTILLHDNSDNPDPERSAR